MLGTSPRFLAEIHGRGIKPCELSRIYCQQQHLMRFEAVEIGTFETLRTISCTGAVLTPPMYEWAHGAFGGKLHLYSPSGGTDICSACKFIVHAFRTCIDWFYSLVVEGSPSLPVYNGGVDLLTLEKL